ncbi:hypothetical protein FOZ62_017806, partial [Perkinsus olseni]
EAGKYILVDADDLGLTSTLFINEDRTANWMFQCNFAGYTRPSLVGPFPLHEDTPSQFIIDYGGPLMPALMRQHCPPIEGVVDTDFSMIRFSYILLQLLYNPLCWEAEFQLELLEL